MIFETKEDINAPLEQVFPCVSDFAGFERSALRRGADIKRLDNLTRDGAGMMWDIKFNLRGKRRELQLELVQFDAPDSMKFHTRSAGIKGVMSVDLIALSRSATRLNITLEMQASNLTGRLMLQSLKLARSSIANRVSARLEEFARATEARIRSA